MRVSQLLLIAVLTHPASAQTLRGLVDEKGLRDGQYVPPNEYTLKAYSQTLKGKQGTLVSVGTFRALEDAAKGEFSQLVLIDYDRDVVGFNRLNIELLKNSNSRIDYIRKIFGVAKDSPLFHQLKEGKVSAQKFIQLSALTTSTPAQAPEEIAMFKFLKNRKSAAGAYIRKDLAKALADRRFKGSFLFSDEAFSTVQALAKNDAIAAVVGDVTGRSAMASIAEKLNVGKKTVSAIDLSNLMEYFVQDPKAFARLAGNLESLPRDPEAVILFSMHGGGNYVSKFSSQTDPFTYASAPLDGFLKDLRFWAQGQDLAAEDPGSTMLFNKIEKLWEALYEKGTLRFHDAKGKAIIFRGCPRLFQIIGTH